MFFKKCLLKEHKGDLVTQNLNLWCKNGLKQSQKDGKKYTKTFICYSKAWMGPKKNGNKYDKS